jgi:hypothetical protein
MDNSLMYVSWKDDKTQQAIPPKRWTLLKFNGQSLITPTIDGLGQFAVYVNVKATGGSKRLLMRFSRDPLKLDDFTGQHVMDLTVDNIESHTWFFLAKKGVPIGVMVYHDGSSALTLATREFKASIG